jgi:hypothetical protein
MNVESDSMLTATQIFLTIIKRFNFCPFPFDRVKYIALFHATLAIPSTNYVHLSSEIADSYKNKNTAGINCDK